MLSNDPKMRPSVSEALNHAYFKKIQSFNTIESRILDYEKEFNEKLKNGKKQEI